jgi:hypothetical protein
MEYHAADTSSTWALHRTWFVLTRLAYLLRCANDKIYFFRQVSHALVMFGFLLVLLLAFGSVGDLLCLAPADISEELVDGEPRTCWSMMRCKKRVKSIGDLSYARGLSYVRFPGSVLPLSFAYWNCCPNGWLNANLRYPTLHFRGGMMLLYSEKPPPLGSVAITAGVEASPGFTLRSSHCQ